MFVVYVVAVGLGWRMPVRDIDVVRSAKKGKLCKNTKTTDQSTHSTAYRFRILYMATTDRTKTGETGQFLWIFVFGATDLWGGLFYE